MGKLTVKGGHNNLVYDLTGKNLLSEIKRILPIENFPAGSSYLDLRIYVDRVLIDLKTFNIDREFNGDVLIFSPVGFTPVVAFWLSVAISAATAVTAIIIANNIETAEESTDSPNNGFSGQSNQIRLGELEPNIYGLVRSYPDLIVGSGGAWEYVNNEKIVQEVFLIGIGEYEKGVPMFESTPLPDISGQSYEYFEPFDIVPEVWGQFNSDAVDGQVLLGPNNSEIDDTLEAEANGYEMFVNTITNYVRLEVSQAADWDAIYNVIQAGEAGQDHAMTMNYVGINGELTAIGSVYNMTLSGGIYTLEINSSNAVPRNTFFNLLLFTLLSDESFIEVTLPVSTNEVQVSFEFLRGLKGSVELTVFLDNGDTIQEETLTYTEDTVNQRFYTEKFIFPVGSEPTKVRIVRFSDDNEDGTDTVQVSQIGANEYRTNVEYGNRTILQTNRRATTQATSYSGSVINAWVQRKTVTYDGTNVITTLNPSRSFADAILHEYTEVYGLSADDLPLDEMYLIDSSLSNGLNYFDYTFADTQQSLKEGLSIIANVARCYMVFTGQGFEIYRNEVRPVAAQFDSRNISASSTEETSYKGAVLTSNDGIQLQWKDPTDNKYVYLYFVNIAGVSTQCIYNNDGTYTPAQPAIPLEMELTGCSTEAQAVDRADLECRSLTYIQKSLKTTTLKDGQEVSRGQVVRHSDYWQTDVTSGEIAAINGNIFTTHNEINLDSGVYYVTYTAELGESYGPVSCTIIDSNNFMAVMPDAYLSDGYSIQSGTRYIISTLEEHENNLYVVNDKSVDENGNVTLEMIEYNEAIYPEED